jgi:hypothetical protein
MSYLCITAEGYAANIFSGLFYEKSFILGIISSFMGISLVFILSNIYLWIAYYYAYRKHGTAWLVIVISVKLMSLIKLLKSYTELSKAELCDVWLFIVGVLGVHIYFFLSCIQLREANIAKQKNEEMEKAETLVENL